MAATKAVQQDAEHGAASADRNRQRAAAAVLFQHGTAAAVPIQQDTSQRSLNAADTDQQDETDASQLGATNTVQEGSEQGTTSAGRIQQGRAASGHSQHGTAVAVQLQQGASAVYHHSSPRRELRIGFSDSRRQFWTAPEAGLKLNIDGRIGDPQCTAGGGIIRDSNGLFIGAFTFFMDNMSISIPELESLLYAATWCKAKG